MYCRCLDFISVMAYDFHGGWEHVTGSHNALYSSPRDVGPHTQLNQACHSFSIFSMLFLKKLTKLNQPVNGLGFHENKNTVK